MACPLWEVHAIHRLLLGVHWHIVPSCGGSLAVLSSDHATAKDSIHRKAACYTLERHTVKSCYLKPKTGSR